MSGKGWALLNLCGNSYYSRASVGNLAGRRNEMLQKDGVRLRYLARLKILTLGLMPPAAGSRVLPISHKSTSAAAARPSL
jgi:hypothetical protein